MRLAMNTLASATALAVCLGAAMNVAVARIRLAGLTLIAATLNPVSCWRVLLTLANISAMPARLRAALITREMPPSPTIGVSTTWRALRLNQGVSMPA